MRYYIVVSFVLFTLSAYSQSVTCTLVELLTNSPMEGAYILSDGEVVTTTDALGEFTVPDSLVGIPLMLSDIRYHGVIYIQPDSTGCVVRVRATINELSGAHAIASIAKPALVPLISLGTSDFQRDDRSSFQNALNTLPGVQYDSRGYGGSRRLNIRGSSIRSPFVVRNFKLYLGEYPLTSPDGQAALEIIDPQFVETIQVIKGPHANDYGPGTGGAVRSWLVSPYSGKAQVNLSTTAGSYNFIRSEQSISGTLNRFSYYLSSAVQATDGYRLQERNEKSVQLLQLAYRTREHLQHSLLVMNYLGSWDLPGGLTDFSKPTFSPDFTVKNNTHVERSRFMVGMSQKFTSRYLENTTTLSLNRSNKINPYGTSAFFNGFKDESTKGFSVRSVFASNWMKREKLSANSTLSIEFQKEENDLDEFNLVNADRGTQRYANNTLSGEWFAAWTNDFTLLDALVLSTGLTVAERSISTRNILFNTAQDTQTTTERSWLRLTPRLGLQYTWSKGHNVFVSTAEAYSPPALTEIIEPATGMVSNDLNAELQRIVEIGLNGRTDRLTYQLSCYQSQL
ncbi:MAG: hypothetical protein RL226_1169, partial [Bacteroidota bacterium]